MISDVDLAKTFSHPIVSLFAQVTFSFLKGAFSFQAVPFVNSRDDFAQKEILKYFPRVPPTISSFFFFQVLHQSLWSILCWSLCMVRDKEFHSFTYNIQFYLALFFKGTIPNVCVYTLKIDFIIKTMQIEKITHQN